MEKYKIFRIVNIILLILLFVFIILYYVKLISQDFFTISLTIVATFATFSAIFSTKPLGREDVSDAVGIVLENYDVTEFQKLKEATEKEKELNDFIENKSNRIFLLKIRAYIEEEILKKYNNSELPKLIADLENIEKQLDSLKVTYNEIELPARFKKVLNDLNQQEQIEMLIDMFDAMPWFPFKKLFKSLIKYKLYFPKIE